MAVRTIEEACTALGQRLQQPDIPAKARAAIQAGNKFEVTIAIRPAKQGGVASMEAQIVAPSESLGTYIRLK